MVEPVDEPGVAIGAKAKKGRGVRFLGVVSLGNILILAGMVGTGMLGIYEVGGIVQHMQDTLAKEISDRDLAVKTLSEQISTLGHQEERDVAGINMTLTDIRADVRLLTAASVPVTTTHRP